MHSSYIYFYNQKNAFKFHIPEKTSVAPIKQKKKKKKRQTAWLLYLKHDSMI